MSRTDFNGSIEIYCVIKLQPKSLSISMTSNFFNEIFEVKLIFFHQKLHTHATRRRSKIRPNFFFSIPMEFIALNFEKDEESLSKKTL